MLARIELAVVEFERPAWSGSYPFAAFPACDGSATAVSHQTRRSNEFSSLSPLPLPYLFDTEVNSAPTLLAASQFVNSGIPRHGGSTFPSHESLNLF